MYVCMYISARSHPSPNFGLQTLSRSTNKLQHAVMGYSSNMQYEKCVMKIKQRKKKQCTKKFLEGRHIQKSSGIEMKKG